MFLDAINLAQFISISIIITSENDRIFTTETRVFVFFLKN